MISNGTIVTSNVCTWKNIILKKFFVVLVFEATFKDAFAAFYMMHLEGYTIWSKVISKIGSNIIVEQTINFGLQQVCNNSESISTKVLSCCCIHAKYSCILKAGITAAPGAVL
jgi:hypothetical protein